MALSKRLALVLGARPNFVKAAPLLREAEHHPSFAWTVIHTGQHYDRNMSGIFFEELGIREPDIFLQITGERHTEKIGKMFNALKRTFAERKFDGVVVLGDVNSTLAGAVAAASLSPIMHVEAGLRSHDRRMPEEINRVIIDHLSDVLFTSEPSGDANLIQEGIDPTKIHAVGNLMIENLEMFRERIAAAPTRAQLGLEPQSYIVVTIHRQENTDAPDALRRLLVFMQEMAVLGQVVFPLHPGTRQKIRLYGLEALLDGLRIIEPLGYVEFLGLVSQSRGVVTDSGGIQEETSHLGVPCCTLRENTERPITLTHGSNKLFSPSTDLTADALQHLARRDFAAGQIPLWGPGVSRRIFDALHAWYGV